MARLNEKPLYVFDQKVFGHVHLTHFQLTFSGFGKSSGEFAIRYYAKNLQKRGINANTIIPGVVNTDAWNGYLKALGPKLGTKNY